MEVRMRFGWAAAVFMRGFGLGRTSVLKGAYGTESTAHHWQQAQQAEELRAGWPASATNIDEHDEGTKACQVA
eukprot:scaffold57636_cov20-Tisochrysis_lutea.AAC.2